MSETEARSYQQISHTGDDIVTETTRSAPGHGVDTGPDRVDISTTAPKGGCADCGAEEGMPHNQALHSS